MNFKQPPRVVLSFPSGVFYAREILHGVFEYVKSHRPWTYITGSLSEEKDFTSDLAPAAVLGLFGSNDYVRRMEKRGIPVINVSERFPGVGTARVLPDNYEAGRVAARHFIEKRFTHFAYTGYKGFEFSKLRLQGFQEELKLHGFTCDTLEFGDGSWGRHSIDPLPQIEEWIRSLPRPVAIFACTDDHARRLLNACERIKVRVPEELIVLGSDNDEIECELSPVPISSIVFPLRRLGYEAAAMVDQLLEGGKPPKAPLRLAPTGVITRRSTDITAIKDPVLSRAMKYISAHAAEPINVADMVQACGASRRYLERKFQSIMGTTPKQEILRVRIAIVKRLLAETSLPMPEIAEAAGFTDAKMLSAIFMRDMSVTPSEYRRNLRNKVVMTVKH